MHTFKYFKIYLNDLILSFTNNNVANKLICQFMVLKHLKRKEMQLKRK